MDLATLIADLEALRDRALDAIERTPDAASLDALQVDFLGRKGELTAVLRGIGGLPAEDRPRVGAVANEVRQALEAAMAERGRTLGTKVRASLDLAMSRQPRNQSRSQRSPMAVSTSFSATQYRASGSF